VLAPKKEKNLKKAEKKLKKFKKEEDTYLSKELDVNIDELKALKKKLSKVQGKPERGIETMFRTTSKNHVEFSAMADSKANIIISVNSIIITIIIGVLLRKLDSNPHLTIPTFILLVVCLVAIVFAILATRPNITSGKFTKDDIVNKKANLLFFGNFHKMALKDFQWGMQEMLNDSDYLYGSMIKDIYFLGVVLGRKYNYLRVSYTVFMYGLVLSTIAFMIATMISGGGETPFIDDDLF
jgi:MFS-type transporter involved in bile tolerance (Atg22 family)